MKYPLHQLQQHSGLVTFFDQTGDGGYDIRHDMYILPNINYFLLFSINEEQFINEFMNLAFCDAVSREHHLTATRVS